MKYAFLIICLGLLLPGTYAQGDADSTKVKKLEEFYTFQQQGFLLDSIEYSPIDTTLDYFYYYNPQFHNFKTNLGNNGSAQKNLAFEYSPLLGFKTQYDYLDDFRFNYLNNVYHDVTQPYAKVFYVNGSQLEENIDIRFSQNINENWNFGVEYKKVGSDGFYQRQRTKLNGFRAYQSFKSKNNRFGIITNLNYNDQFNQENGGIVNDSLFTDFPETNRKGVAVNFIDASNVGRNQELYSKQFVNLGRKKNLYYVDEFDSTYSDSIIGGYVRTRASIFHEFRYNNSEIGFQDEQVDSLNYINSDFIYYSGMKIDEATRFTEMDNTIGVRLLPFRNIDYLSSLGLDLYGGYQYLEYFQRNNFKGTTLRDDIYTNTSVGARINNEGTHKNHASLEIKSVIEGYDQGEFQLTAFTKNHIKRMIVSGGFKYNHLNPTIIFRDYSSVTNNWSNDLNMINSTQIEVDLQIPHLKFQLGGKFDAKENHTYFDEFSEVQQFSSGINIFQVYAKQKFKVWLFHLDLKAQYQQVDKEGIINLPEVITYSSFYLESTLFQKEMLYRIGADLYYASDYYGDQYNVTTRQYETQNSTMIESYPWLEVFLMVNVDRTYFFAKLSNVLEGAAPYTYFAAPHYPMPDRAFKFGIKWEFVN